MKRNKKEINRVVYYILAVFVLLFASATYFSLTKTFNINYFNLNLIPQRLSITMTQKVKTPNKGSIEIIKLNNIKATYYLNTVEETDEEPDIAASGRLIYDGAIALSRDLLKKYKVKWGDMVWVEKKDRYYMVEDTMNERHTGRIDIFTFNKAIKNKSFTSNIIIYKYRGGK